MIVIGIRTINKVVVNRIDRILGPLVPKLASVNLRMYEIPSG